MARPIEATPELTGADADRLLDELKHVASPEDVARLKENARRFLEQVSPVKPLDVVVHCPRCGLQHVDAPDGKGWTNPPHKSHLCLACKCVCGASQTFRRTGCQL